MYIPEYVYVLLKYMSIWSMVSKDVENLSLVIQYGAVAKQLFQYLVSSTKYINI